MFPSILTWTSRWYNKAFEFKSCWANRLFPHWRLAWVINYITYFLSVITYPCPSLTVALRRNAVPCPSLLTCDVCEPAKFEPSKADKLDGVGVIEDATITSTVLRCPWVATVRGWMNAELCGRVNTVRSRYIAVIFLWITTNLSFVNPKLALIVSSVIVVLYTLSCYMWPRYIGST